jgi:hypothetical protein
MPKSATMAAQVTTKPTLSRKVCIPVTSKTKIALRIYSGRKTAKILAHLLSSRL